VSRNHIVYIRTLFLALIGAVLSTRYSVTCARETRQRHSDTDTETQRHSDTETQPETQRHRHRQRDTAIQRHSQRHSDSDTDRETQTETRETRRSGSQGAVTIHKAPQQPAMAASPPQQDTVARNSRNCPQQDAVARNRRNGPQQDAVARIRAQRQRPLHGRDGDSSSLPVGR
jgi:phage-related protein